MGICDWPLMGKIFPYCHLTKNRRGIQAFIVVFIILLISLLIIPLIFGVERTFTYWIISVAIAASMGYLAHRLDIGGRVFMRVALPASPKAYSMATTAEELVKEDL